MTVKTALVICIPKGVAGERWGREIQEKNMFEYFWKQNMYVEVKSNSVLKNFEFD